MLAKTKEMLRKDVVGPPLSRRDELKLPVNRASTSNVNPRLLYNPNLFEGDIYGAKMAEVNLDVTLRNVVANEFIKVTTFPTRQKIAILMKSFLVTFDIYMRRFFFFKCWFS